MARPQNSPILAQLRSAKTYPEQAAALQVLKNEVVGHIQKKEAWISLGVLEPIVLTLCSSRSPSKPNGKDARTQLAWRPLADEDSVRQQALQLIASFASGGPAFLAPLHAARAVPALLGSNFSPLSNPPQIVVAALKALTDIADAAALATLSSCIDIQLLADSLFVPHHIESLNVMLSITSTKHLLQSQVMLAAGLICRLCREERHQHALAAGGVLDSLATQLARFAVRDGLVVPGAEELAYSDGLYEVFPEPACAGAKIGPILEAIAAILGDSKYRANRLANSPTLLAIFPSVKFDLHKGPQSQPHAMTAMEFILPAMPINLSRSHSAAHSSLPTPDRVESRTSSRTSLSKFESPLIPWLIHLVRTLGEYDRLMAVAVLAALFKAGLGRKSVRETSIGLLVVPILIGMVGKNDKDAPDSEGPALATQRFILEKAPAVLARLITDSEYLQKSAYDCDAVKILTKLLKRAYQPVPSFDQPKYWSPQPDTTVDAGSTSASAQLGGRGQNPVLAHRIKLREASLKAIGALSAGKEDYRKALVAEDLVPYVVESLPGGEPARKGPSPAYGTNPVSVIIAGCHVVRMLARSVSILRTSMVDYAVSLPVLHFMTHRDVNVQIAATATVINLVVEVSPVREFLTEKGVMRVLCEHAHSDNPALRLNALWALKHFVDAVGPELKKASLHQLEPGWLVQLICDDSQNTAFHDSRFKDTADDDLDEDMDMQPSDQPFRWLYGSNGSIRELDASRSSRLRQAEDRLFAIRETELNPVRRARNDDIAIQEQGLDFIRNLIGRPESGASSETPSETTEMIDFLLRELGEDRLFEIMEAKLRTKPLHPFSRRTSAPGREPLRVLHPQARIIVAVIYILVHMAASIPRHRQLVVSQTDLLKLLAQQAGSKDREVRVALCHLVINLTCQEDDGEAQQCAARASELKRLGFHTKMETLRHQDRDLDVRERAKTAAWQIDHATY
ncbi:armadillo repeat protein [Hirsutella rhossiliensis]|uniref:Armadillo repeat protein n=1 Tax=Hirsutella rhossiliensis TaxID=111463 RepID=A0A9P8SMT5_9HYPO|nr:armadillo repeat protein [Hirsutella rhossiliensis]KAH0966471.1 armadillo repeat protein [Hirsutella rhossiliensis]